MIRELGPTEGDESESGAMTLPLSDAVDIRVEPVYLADESVPGFGHWVWAYHVRIHNLGDEPVQLLWRHWLIHDPVAGDQEVQGEGVVGQTPWLEPGEIHEYQSFCILESPAGHMEGFYHFRRADESTFRARIPRFELRVPSAHPDTFTT